MKLDGPNYMWADAKSKGNEAELYKSQRDFLAKQLEDKVKHADDLLAIIVWLMKNGHHEAVTAAKVAIRLEKSGENRRTSS